jgi:hypothetical protein
MHVLHVVAATGYMHTQLANWQWHVLLVCPFMLTAAVCPILAAMRSLDIVTAAADPYAAAVVYAGIPD